MEKRIVLLLVVSLSLLTSCSSLRRSVNNEHRVILDKTNFKLIEGKYNPNSIEGKGSSGFISSVFSGGYKMLKFIDYTPESCNNYVKIEVLNSKTLFLSYTTNKNTIKTAKLKGKLKDGYFVLKRNHAFFTIYHYKHISE